MRKFCSDRKSWLILVSICMMVTISTGYVGAEGTEPVRAQNGMVTAAHPLAAAAGLEMLKLGGNAIDAMAATSFALGVVEPQASGLGGEGIMVIHLENPDRDVVIDGRSMAPLDATRAVAMAEARHPAATGVPGIVAAVLKAQAEYGKLSVKTILQPAIKLAREGYPVSRTLASVLLDNFELVASHPATAAIYLPDGFPPTEGTILKNPDLAWSLEQIGEYGADALYKGAIAEKLVAFMEANGGLIGLDDLAAYKAVTREPAKGTFRGYDVIAAGPPVAGANVIENLNMWEQFNPKAFKYDDPLYIHIMSEIMKLASADYYAYVGDPDFNTLPTKGVTSDEYARERFVQLSLAKATLPANNQAGVAATYDNTTTTFAKHVVEGPQAFGPGIYTTAVLNDPFTAGKIDGWTVIDGDWKVADGKLSGSAGNLISSQTFAADRMIELNLQTVERLGKQVYNVGRLYGKYVDSNNQVYVYLRTDGGIRFTVKADGKSENYDAKTTIDPMLPHQWRLMFLGGKAELWIDGQQAIVVENEKMAKLAGGIGLWAQDSVDAYDNISVRITPTSAAAPVTAPVATQPAVAPVPKVPALDYKYNALDLDFTKGLGEFQIVDGDWKQTDLGAEGTKGTIVFPNKLAVDRHVTATMKTLETLNKSAWNVGRIIGKYQDDANSVYAYLRKDNSIRLSVVLDGKNDDYNFPAPGVSPFDEHVFEYYFNGNTVQFLIDGKILAEVTNEKISQIGGGIRFWMQDSRAVVSKVKVDQTIPYEAPGSGSTTHVSIVDKEGNAVSLTQTISSFLGTGDVVPGAGFMLNDEMMNFGSGVNSLIPGKRMRTTTAPTILLDKGDVRLVVGSPGSARIITTVTEVIVNVVDFNMDVQAAIDAPRFYSRNTEGNLQMEGRFPGQTVDFLKAYGHSLQMYGDFDLFFGGVHAVYVDPATKELFGAADPRRDGAAIGF